MKRPSSLFSSAGLGGLLLFSIALMGCEEDVVAVLGTHHPYTVYSVFTPGPDTQYARVFPVQGRLELLENEPLDATVTSTNMTTGEQHVWRDSITVDERGHFSHLFWAPFSVDYGETHKFEVVRSDGERSAAQVTIPEASQLLEGETTGATGRVFQSMHVEGTDARLIRIEVTYLTIYSPGATDDVTTEFTVIYDEQQRPDADGWRIDIVLSEDVQFIREELSKTGNWFPSFGVGLTGINMRLLVVDDAWNPPGGSFDPAVLVQPGTLSNVENGFGFIGAGYPLEITWRPPEEALQLAGFRPMDDGNEEEEEEEEN